MSTIWIGFSTGKMWIINPIHTNYSNKVDPKTSYKWGWNNLQPLFKWPCTWGNYISTLTYSTNKYTLKTNMTLEHISNGKSIFKWWNVHVSFQGVSAMNQSRWIRQKKTPWTPSELSSHSSTSTSFEANLAGPRRMIHHGKHGRCLWVVKP